MRKVSVFNSVSMDGYYTDANNDMSWAHEGANDPELMEFTKGNAQGTNALVFGRVTYEMMVAYWPTPQGGERDAGGGEGDERGAQVRVLAHARHGDVGEHHAF